MTTVRVYIFKAKKGEDKRNSDPADVLFHLEKDETTVRVSLIYPLIIIVSKCWGKQETSIL